MKKILSLLLCLMMFTPQSIYAIENLDENNSNESSLQEIEETQTSKTQDDESIENQESLQTTEEDSNKEQELDSNENESYKENSTESNTPSNTENQKTSNTEELSPYSYKVSDDENFEDGAMSNPDGYEESGKEVNENSVDVIYQSYARGYGYDLTWSTVNGKKIMYDGEGSRFGYGECKKVIDVSGYNGNIDWSSVKASGVDGAILRITSFSGGYMHEDSNFASYLQGCRNVGMPIGVYMYSYANTMEKATNEANYVVSLLKKYNVRPSELYYPVYYDLESNDSVNGVSVDAYANQVERFIGILNASGYTAHVYSYTSYLYERLNTPRIFKYTSWVAQYGPKLKFVNNYYNGNYGWQYRSNGSVSGISGEVDVSCFSNYYGYDTQNHTNQPLGRSTSSPYLEYCARSKNMSWLPYFVEPNTAGTTGRSLPLYQLKFKLRNMPNSSHLSAVIKTSKQTVVYNNIENGTTVGVNGQAMRRVKFNFSNVAGYHLEYRVHSSDIGWQGWVKQGNYAGNSAKDIQAIDFRLVKDSSVVVNQPQIYYRGHIADKGWLSFVPQGQTAGTATSNLTLQAIQFGIDNANSYQLNGSVYVQGRGWKNYSARSKYTVIGTTGQSRALRAVKFNLTELNGYKIQYRIRTSSGWKNWVDNNRQAGNCKDNILAIQFRLAVDKNKIYKIALNKSQLTLDEDKTYQLKTAITPGDTTMDKTITYTSSNSSIVRVNKNGKIKGLKEGSAIITAKSVNGLTSTCKVKVVHPVTDVTLNKKQVQLNKGKKATLSASITPKNATIKTLSWSSSNTKVAKVDSKGNVTAIDAGTAYIVAKSHNGLIAKCKVIVKSPLLGVQLNKKSMTLQRNQAATLKATLNPTNTTDNKKVTWISSNSKVVRVNQKGQIKALKAGKATITVKTSNNKKASCNITVIKKQPLLTYKAHIQNIGWQGTRTNGKTAGTTGKSLGIEALKIGLNTGDYSGSIQYRTLSDTNKWQGWKTNSNISGTTGKNLRVNAIQIKLSDGLENSFDIYYRVHSANVGWLDWAKNGQKAGTQGYKYQVEAVQIKLVKKGALAPGKTETYFIKK